MYMNPNSIISSKNNTSCSMDNLGFDPHGAFKHDSTDTTLSRIHTNK